MSELSFYNRLPVIGVAVLALLAGIWFYVQGPGTARQPIAVPGMLWPNPKPLTAFQLNDQHGQPFGLEQLKGHWSFLFFGYTHCPDVCPTTLSVLGRVSALQQAHDDIQYVFVSVDPERDTPQHLTEYLAYFNPAFVGLTGSEAYLQSLTRQLGIVYFTGDKGADGQYEVDHTASVLLVDPGARLVGVFSAPHDAADISERFDQMRRIVERN